MNFIHEHFSHRRESAFNWKLETGNLLPCLFLKKVDSFSSLSFGMIQAGLTLLSLLRQLTLFRPCFFNAD